MGSCVIRETTRAGRPRLRPRVSLSLYLSIYSIYLVCARVAAVLLRVGEDVLAPAAQLSQGLLDARLDHRDVPLVQRSPFETLLAFTRPRREGGAVLLDKLLEVVEVVLYGQVQRP